MKAGKIYMKVVEYLRKNGIDKLVEEYSIKVREYTQKGDFVEAGTYNDGNFIILNYDQINSRPVTHPIIRECRSLILLLPNFEVVSRSFDRFYNIHESDPEKPVLDYNEMIVYEKLDGSLINVFCHEGEWLLSTRFTFGEAETGNGNSFKDLFISTLGDTLNNKFKALPQWHTYIFEFTSPENRIVTPYYTPNITLLAMRDKEDGHYWQRDSDTALESIANILGISTPKVYNFSSIDLIQESMGELNPLDEGYVCYFPSIGYRVKIKNPSYIVIHSKRMNGNMTVKNILKIIFDNETDEFLSYFPEDAPSFEVYQNAVKALLKSIQDDLDRYNSIENQKEFALKIKDLPYFMILFNMRKHKIERATIDQLRFLTEDKLIELVEIYK